MGTESLTDQKTSSRSFPASIWIYLALTSIFSIFVIAPLFYPGYIQTHQGFIPLWNLTALRTGSAWGGWLPEIATRFDALRSGGVLPYYLAAFLPVGTVTAVKLVLAAGWLLGGVGMFLWLKSWLGRHAALVAALVYTYLPYRIAVVYVRGDWGEALFWALLPWGALATTYLASSPRLMLVPVAAAIWLLAGLSQLGLTLWAAVFVVLLLATVHFRQALLPVLAVALGVIAAAGVYLRLSAFTGSSPVNFSEHFLYPFQLLSAYWGEGASRPGWNDGLSLQLGLAAAGLALVAIILWQVHRPPNLSIARTDPRLLFFSITAAVLILLQLGVAGAVWRVPVAPGYTLADTLTYPWQLLGLTGLCLSVLAGAALWLDSRLTDLPLFGAVVILVLLSSYNYLLPQFIQPDPRWLTGPQAQLGDNQLALLDHDFAVVVSGDTAGLPRGQTAIPLPAYGQVQGNDTLLLNVVWQPLRPFAQNLKVFVHLVDADNNVVVQYDGYPRSGDYPMSQWVPGEMIEDAYPLRLPETLPSGPYRVFLGLYDETTLTRLPVPNDSEGRVILDVK